MEFPRPGAETREETELETRLWPAAEKREMAGDAGEEVLIVKGECGWRESTRLSLVASII
jgi:hypothetical protein